MASNFNEQPPWNVFQFNRLKVAGDAWDKEQPRDRPSVQFKVANNNPRFSLYLNKPGAFDKPITFLMDAITMSAFFEGIRDAVKNPEPHRMAFEINSKFPHKGRQLEEATKIGEIIVGRDENKCVYMAFAAMDEPVAKIVFQTSFYHKLIGSDGERMDRVKMSELVASGYAKLMTDMLAAFLIAQPVEPQQPNGGQQQRQPQRSAPKQNWGDNDDVPY